MKNYAQFNIPAFLLYVLVYFEYSCLSVWLVKECVLQLRFEHPSGNIPFSAAAVSA